MALSEKVCKPPVTVYFWIKTPVFAALTKVSVWVTRQKHWLTNGPLCWLSKCKVLSNACMQVCMLYRTKLKIHVFIICTNLLCTVSYNISVLSLK